MIFVYISIAVVVICCLGFIAACNVLEKSHEAIENRKEPRKPVVDKAEITLLPLGKSKAVKTEKKIISVSLLNISSHGCAVVSQQFIKPGRVVSIETKSGKLCFQAERAKTCYNHPVSKGLQIGFEFEKPLQFNFDLAE